LEPPKIVSEQTARLPEEVACAARAFAVLGYVHAFGHVSARLASTLLITPTKPPLATQGAADILEADFNGDVVRGDRDARPIEIFLHIGVYQARADVAAICRTHAPAASLWPAAGVPPIQHGFGGIAADIATLDSVDLVHDAAQGAAAAKALGTSDALMLRGNGVLTVGSSVGQAAARMWSLEERCSVALRQSGGGKPFTAEDLRMRQRWYPAEQNRIWLWLQYLAESSGHSSGVARPLRQPNRST
jgi:ribulose-5-phosphate 4-epimerase/fuculose-1-phosphate aldolase